MMTICMFRQSLFESLAQLGIAMYTQYNNIYNITIVSILLTLSSGVTSKTYHNIHLKFFVMFSLLL